MSEESQSQKGHTGGFPQTRWSLVGGAQRGQTPSEASVRRAMDELCQIYWSPLYSFIRRDGWSREDAEDLTQEFLARVVDRSQLDKARPEKGKLRSFLITFLKHFLSDKRKANGAQKRGGGRQKLSLDAEGAEVLYSEIGEMAATPEAIFEQSWVLAVLENALVSLQKSYEEADKGELFEKLKPTLQAGGKESSHAATAAALGMKEGALKVAAHRLRLRYREELHAHIRETLDEGEDVEEELRYFFRVLEGAP